MLSRGRTVRLLAEILAGIQAPGSMNLLGAASEPWIELRTEAGMFGWMNADETEEKLKSLLEAPHAE